MFNALKYTEELERAGFTREQADVTMKLLIEIMNDSFATKGDLQGEIKMLRSDLQSEAQTLRSEIQSEAQTLRSEIQSEAQTLRGEIKAIEWRLESKIQDVQSSIRELEYKMVIKLGSIVVFTMGAGITVLRLFPAH